MKIYYAQIDRLCSAVSFEEAMQCLPKHRLEKLHKIRQKERWRQSFAAGLLLEYGLQKEGLSGKKLTFLENSDGKPYLLEQPDFFYNLSHSGAYAALVISDTAVGIDVEQLRTSHKQLVNRFFAEDECRMLSADFSDEAFIRMWTRKESYLKACGMGMRMPLNGFSAAGEIVRVNEQMPPDMAERDAFYYLESYRFREDYWLSVCQRGMRICAAPKEIEYRF